MPTKTTTTTVPADLLGAARSLWFAGLGAMVVAQEEGKRLADGTATLFTTLVEKGEEMQKKDGPSPLDRVKEAASTAEETWTRMQTKVDARITGALQRLGVPTKDEMAELSRRIEQLTASIEALKAQG